MSTPLPLRVVAFSPARLYGVPFSTAARSTSSGVALYWTRAASAVLGKTEGPAGPLCENSGPMPKELFRNSAAECSR